MLKSLYSKMLAWLLLNLLLIALVGGGFVFFVLFSNTYGLVPASLFSSNVENVFRVLSTELQYRSTQEWSAIVKAYDRPGLQFHLVSLDDPWLYFAGDFVPLAILETAQRIPRSTSRATSGVATIVSRIATGRAPIAARSLTFASTAATPAP